MRDFKKLIASHTHAYPDKHYLIFYEKNKFEEAYKRKKRMFIFERFRLMNVVCYLEDFHNNIATPETKRAVPPHLQGKRKCVGGLLDIHRKLCKNEVFSRI